MSETSNSDNHKGPWINRASKGEIRRWLLQGVDPELLVTPTDGENPHAGDDDALYDEKHDRVFSVAPDTSAAQKLGDQALNDGENKGMSSHNTPEQSTNG